MNAHERAKKCAELMLKNDYATKHVGITLDEVRPGYAKMSMKVELYHLILSLFILLSFKNTLENKEILSNKFFFY